MRHMAIVILALVVLVGTTGFTTKTYGAGDEYETLEFFLDQALKNTKTSNERTEILNRYMIKALGMVYRQNVELIRLQRQTLEATQELRDIEKKESRDLEIQIQRNQ